MLPQMKGLLHQAARGELNDRPAEEDVLGVDAYYAGIAAFLRTCETPMTLTLNGGWGTGKTSALNIIKSHLGIVQSASQSSPVAYLDFDAWYYEASDSTEDLTLTLMMAFASKVGELLEARGEGTGQESDLGRLLEHVRARGKSALRQTISIGFKTLTNVTLGAGAADAIGENIDSLLGEQDIESSYERMKSAKDDIQRCLDACFGGRPAPEDRLYVFIDNLDRLRPERALAFLEGIKNFLDCKGCVFVLAADFSIVRTSIALKYGEGARAQNFFDKIVQVPFRLPVEAYRWDGFIEKELSAIGIELASTQERMWAVQRFVSCTRNFLRQSSANPRSVKRAFNLMKLYQLIEQGTGSSQDVWSLQDWLYEYAVLLFQMQCEQDGSEELISELVGRLAALSQQGSLNSAQASGDGLEELEEALDNAGIKEQVWALGGQDDAQGAAVRGFCTRLHALYQVSNVFAEESDEALSISAVIKQWQASDEEAGRCAFEALETIRAGGRDSAGRRRRSAAQALNDLLAEKGYLEDRSGRQARIEGHAVKEGKLPTHLGESHGLRSKLVTQDAERGFLYVTYTPDAVRHLEAILPLWAEEERPGK